jgi:hypothetical protein
VVVVHLDLHAQRNADPRSPVTDLGFTLPRGFGQLNLERESNFAVWYSSALLLMGGGAALLVAFSPRPPMAGAKLSNGVDDRHSLVALSVDAVEEFRERIGRWFIADFGTVPILTDGAYNVFAWVSNHRNGIVLRRVLPVSGCK